MPAAVRLYGSRTQFPPTASEDENMFRFARVVAASAVIWGASASAEEGLRVREFGTTAAASAQRSYPRPRRRCRRYFGVRERGWNGLIAIHMVAGARNARRPDPTW